MDSTNSSKLFLADDNALTRFSDSDDNSHENSHFFTERDVLEWSWPSPQSQCRFSDGGDSSCAEALNQFESQNNQAATEFSDEGDSSCAEALRLLETNIEKFKPVSQKNTCPQCHKSFTQRPSLLRHLKTVHDKQGTSLFSCEECGRTFKRRYIYLNHLTNIVACDQCEKSCCGSQALYTHKACDHANSFKKRKAPESRCAPPLSKFKQSAAPHPAMPEQSSASSMPLTNGQIGGGLIKCNYCKINKPMKGFRFCKTCGEGKRECTTCRFPRHQTQFHYSPNRCDTCVTRTPKQRGGALGKHVQELNIEIPLSEKYDLLRAMKAAEPKISQHLIEKAQEKKGIKFQVRITCSFEKPTKNEEDPSEPAYIYAEPGFLSTMKTFMVGNDPENELSDVWQELFARQENYQRDGSGWIFKHVYKIELMWATYQPLQGSSYLPLPYSLSKKQALVNPRNQDDDKCIVWATLAAKHPVPFNEQPQELRHYQAFEHEINVTGLSFPTPITQLSKFEQQNDFALNVFGYESDKPDGKPEIFPVYISKRKDSPLINLLLISTGEKAHYVAIRSLSALLAHRTKSRIPSHYCQFCLHPCSSEAILKEHIKHCGLEKPQKIRLPEKGKNILEFNEHHKQLEAPFIIVADFESFLEPVSSCSNTAEKSFTETYQHHTPASYGYKVICGPDDSLSKPLRLYRGPQVIENFLNDMREESRYITNILKNPKPLVMSDEDEEVFQTATHCHICQKHLANDKVRDHCHVSGKFTGAAHNKCNRNYRLRYNTRVENEEDSEDEDCPQDEGRAKKYPIPIFIHNLKKYDAHLIFGGMTYMEGDQISCVAQTIQNYVTFSIGNLEFKDSLAFLNCSLDKLVANLRADGEDKFFHLQSEFPEGYEMLLRKGVFPYDFLTDESKFSYPELPPKSAFFNKLNNQGVSDDDYEYAQTVWEYFNMENFGHYHDLYLASDILLLCDVFQEFRKDCMKHYKLDPAHYCTMPGYSWSAMLKTTNVKLELLTDPDMYLFFEQSIRGGISVVSKKFAKANNPHIPETYDSQAPEEYLMYWDMNNLYGSAMNMPLPQKDFQWCTTPELRNLDVMSIPADAKTGYVLEVDLKYPAHLHDKHSQYPLAVESMVVEDHMLSPYSKKLKAKLGLKGHSSRKLMGTLYDKKSYVVHYRNLQFYLQQGLELVQIKRGVKFTQSKWLAPFINLNTELRKKAKSPFEKDLRKLMNNSVFGKTMENLRKRTRCELYNDDRLLLKHLANSNLKTFKVFNEALVALQFRKVSLFLNKPIYVGFSILDLSKLLMAKFHYEFLMDVCGPEHVELCVTDTDSFIYHFKSVDPYQLMRDNLELFDTSDYPPNHPLHSTINKKVLGKMKDEMNGIPIKEVVALKSKMYSISYQNKEKKTAKGIKMSVTKQDLTHEQYKETLFGEKSYHTTMNNIRSINHQLQTQMLSKRSLSGFDDKRYVKSSPVYETISFGHYSIRE